MKQSRDLSRFVGVSLSLLGSIILTACNDGNDPTPEQEVKIEWSQTNGPNGGDINAVAAVGDNVLAGTSHGIFLTVDNGEDWKRISDMSTASLITTNDGVFAGTPTGVAVYNENGNTWAKLGSLEHSVTTLLSTESGLFAGTSYSGIHFWSDDGQIWTAVNNGLSNLHVRSLAIDGDRIYAGTDGGGVFVSDDAGQNWAPSNSGLTNLSVNALLVAGDYIFAGTHAGAFVSANDGATWASTALTGYITFSLETDGNDVLAGTNGGVWRSSNNGATWTSMNNGLSNYIANGLLVTGNLIFCGTQDGVFISSDNGESWQRKNDGLVTQSVISLAWLDNKLFAGTYGTVHFTDDNGAHWNVANAHPLSQFVDALTVNGTMILEGTDGTSFQSTDGGATWTIMPGLNGLGIDEFLIDGNEWYGSAVAFGVFVSTDNGENWSPMNTGLTDMQLRGMAKSGDNVFVGTGGSGIFRSTAGGDWMQVNNGLNDDFAIHVMDIAAVENTIVAGTIGGIFVSEDNGETWTKTLTGVYANELSVGEGIIAAATYSGVFVSKDLGKTWTAENWNLTNYQVRSVAVGKEKIAIGVEGGGTFISPLPSAIGI